MKFIITGCGRSGTNYVAERLNSFGIKCGHESVFRVTGAKENLGNYDGDSSWFSAPFLGKQYPSTKILHIVRDPKKVIESFHRIGLFNASPLRHVLIGQSFLINAKRYKFNLKKLYYRYNYVMAHRNLLKTYTSCWEKETEFERLCEYWYQWNKIIEERVNTYNLPYMICRLEDIDNRWNEIVDFLALDIKVKPGNPINKKNSYPYLLPFEKKIPEKICNLARKYNYDY